MRIIALRAELGAEPCTDECAEAEPEPAGPVSHEGWNSVAFAESDPLPLPPLPTPAPPLVRGLFITPSADLRPLLGGEPPKSPSRGEDTALGKMTCSDSASYFLCSARLWLVYCTESSTLASVGRIQAGDAVITAPM